jgi:predicted secreted hydrolase
MTERRRVTLVCLLLLTLAACGADDSTRQGTGAGVGAAPGLTGIRYLAAAGEDADGFARALQPRAVEFPADHLPHPEFRTEWWYFTGNAAAADDRHYGFELTLFRIALTADAGSRESALAASQVWMGNLAVTDTAGRRFQAAERLSRGAAGLAGATLSPGGEVEIAVEDWAITIDGDNAILRAADADFGIELRLRGIDAIVPQGRGGLDTKGPGAGNASFYFSAPRLAISGEIRSAGEPPVAVDGTAWMDREWSTSALSSELTGWDWFALQLDDGRNLMFYRLRSRDGGTSPYSSGSISAGDGRVTPLAADDVGLEPVREWTSPTSGVRYPVGWQLTIPSLDLELQISPRLDRQELDLSVRYWEGAVAVSGHAAATSVTGVGYLELAGY